MNSSETLTQFAEKIRSDATETTPLFGKTSLLASLLDSREPGFSATDALQAVQLCRQFNVAQRTLLERERSDLLLVAFEALLQITTNPHSTAATELQRAMEALDSYWPASCDVYVTGKDSFFPRPANVQSALTGPLTNHRCAPRTVAAIDWLLADWGKLKLPNLWSASTSIVSSVGLFRLDVELLPIARLTPGSSLPPPTKGVFVPDFPAFALTSIRDTDPERDTLLSMERAWIASRLAKNWHGRWRIVSSVNQTAHDTALEPARFEGRSAEAAALCTLLAATRNPYCYDDTQPTSWATSLDSKVALSAKLDFTLDSSSHSEDPTKIALLVEGGDLKKLEESDRNELDLLLFGPKSQWETATPPVVKQWVQEFIDARKQAYSDDLDYTGIDVGFVSTVGEALDRLLLTNRLLTRHRDRLRSDWLSRWTGDTGKASVDLRPWPPSDVSSP
jgi:hypothetical protein